MKSRAWASLTGAALVCCLTLLPTVIGASTVAAATPTHGGNLIIGTTVETPSLDPFHQGADARIQRTVLMYQGLTWADDSGRIEPLLATGWTLSDHGRVYTFTLRHGVYFHSGQLMTSRDVAYSYNYLRNPKNGSPGAGDLSAVTSITPVGKWKVRFTLSHPDASLPGALAGHYGGVIPAGYFDHPGAELNNREDGTGPFMLEKWVPNQYLKLVRNPHYWQKGLPYLNSVTFVIVPDENTLVSDLESGRIDLALPQSASDYYVLQRDRSLRVQVSKSLIWDSLDLNCGVKPTDNVLVRRAIELSIDKKAVMIAAVEGVGKVIGEMPAGMTTWALPTSQLPNQVPDIAKAKALLAQAGYPHGITIPLRIISGFSWMGPAANVIASELARAGITADIQKVDLGVWINAWVADKSPNTLNEWGTVPDPGLLYYRHFHMRPLGADFRNWNNVQGSRLLDQAQQAETIAAQKALYDRFQVLLAQSAPTIPLFSPDIITATQKWVHGYVQHPSGWYYGVLNTWLSPH